MHPVTLWFGGGVFAVLVLSLFAGKERDDASLVGLMLFSVWAFYKALSATIGWHDAKNLYPLTDLIQLLVVLENWLGARRQWKRGIIAALLAKLLAHVIFRVTGAHGELPYNVFLNAAFALELACAMWPGGERVGGYLGHHLLGRRPGRHLPVSAAGPQ